MSQQSYTDEIIERSRRDSRLSAESFGQDVYEMYCVPVEVYERYKDQVLRLSLSYQKWVAAEDGGVLLKTIDQLSDKQIAERLGLDEEVVRRIRCMAEWDLPLEVWRNAAEFKRRSRLEKPLGSPLRDVKTEPG